ncbi:MAG TPA: RNA polymerase sigma factor [Desulfomonilaceae bacterium]|nr:RNA polymerase sigma factor [Desulfomonilaceae bacterium]
MFLTSGLIASPTENTLLSCQEIDLRDINSCLDGDGNAYARLVERNQSMVAARMWRFTRDKTAHQELVQEVFVEAYLSLSKYGAKAPFQHWLSRIATIVGYRFWKYRSRERSRSSIPIEEELDQLVAAEPESMDPSVAADVLHSLLEQLPPRDRLVLVLRYVEDRSVEETAELTGWTGAMVKVQSWRARKKLRKLLQDAGVEVE